jgi:hypothetical protein
MGLQFLTAFNLLLISVSISKDILVRRRERDLNPIVVTPLEGEGINNDKYLWKNYEKYLISQGQSKHTIRNKLQYAKRFYQIL